MVVTIPISFIQQRLRLEVDGICVIPVVEVLILKGKTVREHSEIPLRRLDRLDKEFLSNKSRSCEFLPFGRNNSKRDRPPGAL